MIHLALLTASLLTPAPTLALLASAAAPPPGSTSPGRELRERLLASSAAELGFKPSKAFPVVYGVLMDLPMGEVVVTVVSFSDGSASLYTTREFGIIGGEGHATVRKAAIRFVQDAAGREKLARPTSDHSYPPEGQVRFFLLTFRGLKKAEDAESSLQSGASKLSVLYARARQVVTELGLATEGPQKRGPAGKLE